MYHPPVYTSSFTYYLEIEFNFNAYSTGSTVPTLAMMNMNNAIIKQALHPIVNPIDLFDGIFSI